MGGSSSKAPVAQEPEPTAEFDLDMGGAPARSRSRRTHRSAAARWPAAATAASRVAVRAVAENLESSLRKLIPLVHAGDTKAQQQAASCLANLAVQDEHQVTIVKQGGLLLLIPLMTKGDVEVQRLAAHAVANLAVNGAPALTRRAPLSG